MDAHHFSHVIYILGKERKSIIKADVLVHFSVSWSDLVMNHCLWKRHELWNQKLTRKSSQWLLTRYPRSQAITDLRLFHCIPSYANLVSNTSEKTLNEPQPAIMTSKCLVHRMMSNRNWNLHSAFFSRHSCKGLATAGVMASWLLFNMLLRWQNT